jgi:hypothetical protein
MRYPLVAVRIEVSVPLILKFKSFSPQKSVESVVRVRAIDSVSLKTNFKILVSW